MFTVPASARAISRALLMAVGIGASLPTGANATSLTLAEAQRIAIARSQSIVAQDAAVTAAREMAVAAGQLPDPVATIGINNLPINGPDAWSTTADFMTMRSVGLMQEFTRTDKREARAARFDREADRSLAEKRAAVAAIQRDTALAWIDRYYVESMANVVSDMRRAAATEIEAAESAYRAGRGSLADVLAARGALAALDDRASEYRRRTSTTRIALARYIGDEATEPLVGTPDINRLDIDPRIFAGDLAHHPEVAVLTQKEAIAAAEVKLAQANKKADWSVAFMYSQRGPAYSNMISLNVSIPLQWDQGERQDREVAAKLALLDQARAEREDVLRTHAAEVRVRYVEWESDRERSRRYEKELIPLASERTQAALAAYRGAKTSLSDVLLARRGELDLKLQALELELDTARLWAQLNFLDASNERAPSMQHGTDQP